MKDKGFECIYFEEKKQWGCYLTLDGNEPNYSDTEADARAKMLIYLKENNRI